MLMWVRIIDTVFRKKNSTCFQILTLLLFLCGEFGFNIVFQVYSKVIQLPNKFSF